MLDGAIIVPLQAMLWSLMFEIAALLWIIDRALLIVAYFLMAITGWITQQVFAPLLTVVGDQTGVLVGPIFMIAITVLGFTYLMAVFGKFHVVSLRSAVLWLLFAAGLYTFGPNFYLGMESFRREMAGGFYEAGIEVFNSGGSVTGLNAIGTSPTDAVTVPTDQLGAFLPLPSVTAVDGVDVALAYLDADGYDMLGASGAHPLARLPWSWVVAGGDGFFDPDTGADAFSTMTDAERQASLALALQGISRMFTGTLIALFAVVEQLVHFILAASFAVAFLSMFVATLFGFFIRTEPIAWSSLEMVIELFIQTLINSLLMSLVVGFVLIGANSGNAILLLGGGAAGLFMAWNLLQGTLKGLMNATDRLYKSFASATGGNFATAGETRESAGKAAVGAATGAAIMAGGGSFLQAMGGAFGDARTAQTMNYASRMLGGEDTLLGRAAEAVGEGASARTMGGPVGGALLGAQNRRNRQDEADREARLAYTGGADADREAALADYRETLDRDALTGAFDEEDAQRVQALTLTYDDDQVDAVADTVRRVRNANPDLPPDSPAFQRAVRDDLPPDLGDIETAALNDMATVFGASAEPQPGRYDKATALFQPIPTPGAADTARDAALAAYRGSGDEAALGDAFSPEDANRVARLMDAYDDDDFAEVIAAVRAARDANPDLDPDSPRALTAARAELSPRLAPMPSSDLRAFSRAFGASGTPPTLVEPETDLPYIGRRDQRRDAALADYRADGHEDGLLNVYSPLQAQQVMELDGEYAAEDFEAVVRAVRQARTEDPDLEAGSTRAVRAARRQLPDRLRQMPSQDLAAFSGIYGAEADAPAASDTLKRGSRRPAPEVEPVRLSDVLSPDESRTLALAFGPDVDAEDLMIYPNQATRDNPPSPAAPTRPAPPAPQTQTGVATQPLPTPTEAAMPLTRISGIGPATQVQLRAAGIETVEDLAQADPAQLAELPRVTRSRAQAWVVAAGMMTAPSVPPNAPLPSHDAVPAASPSATPGPFTATGRAALRQQQVAAATPPPPDDGPPPPRDYSQVTPPPIQQAAPLPPTAPIRPQSPDAEPPPPRDDSQATPRSVQQAAPPPDAPQHHVETSATRQQPAPSSPRPTERTPSAQGTPTPTPSAPQRRVDTPTAPPAQGAPPPTPIAPQRRTDTPAAPPTQGAPTPPAPAPQRRADTPTAPPAQGAPQPTPPAPQRPVAPSPPSTAQGAPAPTPPAPQRRTDTSVAPPVQGAPQPAPPTPQSPTEPPVPQRPTETPRPAQDAPPPPLTSSDSPSTDSSAPSDPLASQEDHVT